MRQIWEKSLISIHRYYIYEIWTQKEKNGVKSVHGDNCYMNMTDKLKTMMEAKENILEYLEIWISEEEKKHNTSSLSHEEKGSLYSSH